MVRSPLEEKKYGKRVRVSGMEEFLAEAESESLVVASPRFGEVGSELAQEVVAEAASNEEEDEEENLDTHFKRKCKTPPLGAFPRKMKMTVRPSNWCYGTLQIKEAEASPTFVPSFAPPVTEPAVSRL